MVSASPCALFMSAPSVFIYSIRVRISRATRSVSAFPFAPLAFTSRSATPRMLSSLTRTPRVRPIISTSVWMAALLSAMARLACRWRFRFASRSACAACSFNW